MDRQPEGLREPLGRGVEVPHDDRQLHDVAQHGAPLLRRRRSYSRIRSLDSGTPGGDLTTMPKRWALSVPLDGFTLAEHAELAREAERLGYTDAWSFEADGVDCFSPLAVVGLVTHLRVGTAIANVYTRGPATLALSAAGLAEIAPGRFCLGIGSGSQPIVEAWNGGTFSRPATRVREMTTFLRQALAGERGVFQGETFTVEGFRLSRPPAVPIQ